MTNFILPYSQKHILTLSVHDDPFYLFDCLRFFHDKLSKFAISLDNQNSVSITLCFETEIELDQNFFFQLPMSLLSAKTMKLCNLDQVETVNLYDLLEVTSEQRFFELSTKLAKINEISFGGLYPSKIPPTLSNYNEILSVLKRENLLQIPPGFICRNIEFDHFGDIFQLAQNPWQHDEKTDLKLKSKSLNMNLLIKTDTYKKRPSSLDFNHPGDYAFAKHFEQLFSTHMSKMLSFQFYIWDNGDVGSVRRDPRAEVETKKFLNEISKKVITFLTSEKMRDIETSIKEQKLLAAVTLLDERKKAIAFTPKIETGGGFKFKVPSNEYETVILFSAMVAEGSHPFYQFELHEYASSQGIDCISTYKIRRTDVTKSTQSTEFEYKLSNFFKHGHPIEHTELIICWRIDTCPYELTRTNHPWLYNLNIDGHAIPVVEIEKFENIKVIS